MYSDNSDKWAKAIVAGLSYFSTGGGAIWFIVGLIGALVVVPMSIAVPVVAVSAVILGCLGVRHAIRSYKQSQAIDALNLQAQERANDHLVVLVQNLESEMKEFERVHHYSALSLNEEDKEINADDFFFKNALSLAQDKSYVEEQEIDADDLDLTNVTSIYQNKAHFFAVGTKDSDEDLVAVVADELPKVKAK